MNSPADPGAAALDLIGRAIAEARLVGIPDGLTASAALSQAVALMVAAGGHEAAVMTLRTITGRIESGRYRFADPLACVAPAGRA